MNFISILLHLSLHHIHAGATNTWNRRSLAFLPPRNIILQSAKHIRTSNLFVQPSDDNIRSIYQQVQQDDADWFNSLSKLLGEDDGVVDLECKNNEGDADMNESVVETSDVIIEDGVAQSDEIDAEQTELHSTHHVDIEPIVTKAKTQIKSDKPQSNTEQSEKETIQQSESVTSLVIDNTLQQNQKGNNFDHSDDSIKDNKTTSQQRQMPESTSLRAGSSPTQTVQLRNKHTHQCKTMSSLSYFLQRGYTQNQVLSLRPRVLELIVEDDIPKPRRGIPDRWVRDLYEDLDEEDVDWVVEVVDTTSDRAGVDEIASNDSVSSRMQEKGEESKSQSSNDIVSESWGPFSSSRVSVEEQKEVSSADDRDVKNKKEKVDDTYGNVVSEQTPGEVSYRKSSDTQPQQKQMNDNDDAVSRQRERRSSIRPPSSYYNDDNNPTSPQRSRRPSSEQRRSRPRKRRELVIDNADEDDNPPPNKFWMDLPTFRDFLRTEARLRLKILGPEWKESVLDESRWRFDLYKKWLYLLNDGVGENPLYTYGDRPRRPRRPRSSQRERGYESFSTRERPTSTRDRTRWSERENIDRGMYTKDTDSLREKRYEPEDRRGERQKSTVARTSKEGSKDLAEDETLNELGETRQRSRRIDDLKYQKDNGSTRGDGDEGARYYRQRDEPENPRPQRRERSSEYPSQKWKDFGDLEDQLINGSREEDAPRRRVRSFDQFNEDY
jgi:hypothetical protein